MHVCCALYLFGSTLLTLGGLGGGRERVVMITLSLLGNACSSQDCAEISAKLLGLNAYLRFQRIRFSEMVITSLSLLMKADNPQ